MSDVAYSADGRVRVHWQVDADRPTEIDLVSSTKAPFGWQAADVFSMGINTREDVERWMRTWSHRAATREGSEEAQVLDTLDLYGYTQGASIRMHVRMHGDGHVVLERSEPTRAWLSLSPEIVFGLLHEPSLRAPDDRRGDLGRLLLTPRALEA